MIYFLSFKSNAILKDLSSQTKPDDSHSPDSDMVRDSEHKIQEAYATDLSKLNLSDGLFNPDTGIVQKCCLHGTYIRKVIISLHGSLVSVSLTVSRIAFVADDNHITSTHAMMPLELSGFSPFSLYLILTLFDDLETGKPDFIEFWKKRISAHDDTYRDCCSATYRSICGALKWFKRSVTDVWISFFHQHNERNHRDFQSHCIKEKGLGFMQPVSGGFARPVRVILHPSVSDSSAAS